MDSSSLTAGESSTIRARMPIHVPQRPPQMLREGPIPRAPGEREQDFYERMTPRNQRLTQLYSVSILLSAAAFALLLWSLMLIKTEKLFSNAAKQHLLQPYSWTGYGIVMAILAAAAASCVANLSQIVNTESPLPEIVAAGSNAILSSLLAVFGLLSYSMTAHHDSGSDSSFDPCTAPGADPWKRLPCGLASERRFVVQMGGLACVGISAILYFALFVLHVGESWNQRGQGELFLRPGGYVRLNLDPYEIHDDDDPSVHLK